MPQHLSLTAGKPPKPQLGTTATATVNRQQLPVTQMSARSQSGKVRKLPSSYVSIRLSLSVSVSLAVTSLVYQFLSASVYTSLVCVWAV